MQQVTADLWSISGLLEGPPTNVRTQEDWGDAIQFLCSVLNAGSDVPSAARSIFLGP